MFKKIIKISAAGLTLSLALVSVAFADTYSANVTIDLSSPDVNLTILAGSTANSITVQTSHLAATIPANSTFTVTSASRDLTVEDLSVQASRTTTCDSNLLAKVVITTGTAIETINIRPTSAQCSFVSGGGGGGGGGGGATPSPTPAPAPTPGPTPSPTPPPASGGAGTHPNGTLVNDNGTIYLIKDGKKLGFRNEKEYLSHGYKFAQAVPASAADKALPSQSAVAKAMEGTLVLDASDNRTVYMVGLNGTKRGFTSMAVLKGLGYNLSGLPKINLSDYPAGTPIGTSTEAHPDGALVKQGQTIWWIRNGQKTGFETMAVFNTYGFKVSEVVKANASDTALTEGSIVKFRDGTLIKDGANYFLISDGKKLMFSSSADLTARGYKTSNAISASLSAYASGGSVQ